MPNQNIVLQLTDNKSPQTLLFQMTPLQMHAIMKILGLDFDTSTGKVEYFNDTVLEQILANDKFLLNLEKRRPKNDDIHEIDEPKKGLFGKKKKK